VAGPLFLFLELLVPSLGYAVPLIFAGTAEVLLERTGVINIGMEGVMLTAAFVAAAVAYTSGSPVLGMAAAMGMGLVFALIYAILTLVISADQIVAGIGLYLMGTGASVLGLYSVFKSPLMPFPIPSTLPAIQVSTYGKVSYLFFVGIVVAAAAYYFLFRTKAGLAVRSVGENPEAADAAGISVFKVRFIMIVIDMILVSIAGAYFSVDLTPRFQIGMTNGDGFIALAMAAFANWNPLLALGGGIIFGITTAIPAWSSIVIGVQYPVEFTRMIPFIVVILVLAGVIGRVRAPGAIGRLFKRE
jgi:general nucleoside transport system permease protein